MSFVIPVLNNMEKARETTQQLANQSLKIPIEIIVVDDGSTPAIDFEIEATGHSRFKLLRHQVNQGRANACNTGFRVASADYVGFLDVDCVPDKHFVYEIYKMISLQHNLIFGHVVFNSTEFFFFFENDVQRKRAHNLKNWESELTTACVIIKKNLIEAINGFDEKFRHYGFEDRDFFIRLKKQFPNLYPVYNFKAQVTHCDNLEVNNYLKKFENAGIYSSRIFSKSHPDIYKASNYFVFDWKVNPKLHWIPKPIMSFFLYPTLLLLKILFNYSMNYKIKRMSFKALKGISFLKGTLAAHNNS